MIFQIRPFERKIFELITEAGVELGYPVYVVGGYVRDRLLNNPSKDIDIVCVGSGIRLAEQLAGKLRPVPRVAVYKRFGTAMLRHKDLEIEFVGARKESYTADSRKPSVEEGSLEDDQMRRDFTINALAVSLNVSDFGQLIDPFNGLIDLEKKILKTPQDPGTTFSDDPLRMLRAIRFAAQLDFEISEETLEAISKQDAHRVQRTYNR
jgi:tRNA nucleotidyltransferase/poly(A) polymerase